jgi:uncharacterized protein with von Willebrand factor type A (vWA) domain
MFQRFFSELRDAKVPISLKEYLLLMEAMDKEVIESDITEFYYLSRSALVKDERNLDKFDRVFGHVFKGLEKTSDALAAAIPEDWLRALTEKYLTEEEKAEIESLGGWEKLMETLQKRLEEQKERHEGGNKWISASIKTSMIRLSLAPVTSKLLCAACVVGPAMAPLRNSTSKAPSIQPRRMAISML